MTQASESRPDLVERWRDVPGYLGLYEVSDLGRVRSVAGQGRAHKGVVLKPSRTSKKRLYQTVSLYKDQELRTVQVAGLVAAAFLPPRPGPWPFYQLRHWDGDTDNNCVSNLLWGTAQDNSDDKERHGRIIRGERHPFFGKPGKKGMAHGEAKLTDNQVREIRSGAGRGVPQRLMASEFGVCQATIWKVINGRGWTHVA